MGVHIVTGATGFVGGALVLELLARTEHTILCLVRPGEQDPQQRLMQALTLAADMYAAPDSVRAALANRVQAVAGDVEQPGCGVDLSQIHHRCDTFWHSAASLRFEDRHAESIFKTNIDGTRHALALADALGVRHFNHFSTAYVAGLASGRIAEERQSGAASCNLYEKSKVAAEALVLEARQFAVRIMRPSVVIGHSQTLGVTNFTGMYGLLRNLYAFASLMARTQENLLQQEPLHIRCDVGMALDLVPVDRVVANALTIHLATENSLVPGMADFFHLNNPTPPTVDMVLRVQFRMVGIAEPGFILRAEDMHGLSWLDEKFNQKIEFYRNYFYGEKIFERSKTERLVGPEDPAYYAISEARLEQYCRWYFDRLVVERANLPETR